MEARNLTEGGIMRNIISFSLPYLLSYFLQILYGMVDLFIIGQYCGVASITAVSIGSQVMHMLSVIIIGLAMGTTVVVGQAIGAKNNKRAVAVVGNTISLFMMFALFLTVVLLAGAEGIVSLVKTPAEAVAGTKTYLYICFIGIPFIVAYNIIASIFRGLGDSKSPMYFIAIACVANILLDILFIGIMDLDATGAALATTLAQTLCVIISLIMIRKRRAIIVHRSDLKPRHEEMSAILKIGIPVALQDGFIQVSFMVITVIANLRGLNDAAAVGVVEKVIGALFIVPSAMLSAVSAIGAQNYGAGKMDRVKSTLWNAMGITVTYGIILAIFIQFTADQVVGIFTDDPNVIHSGGQYLRSYILDTGLAGIHFCFSGFFCACGYSIISFIHNFASILLARVPLSYLFSINYPDTLFPMGIAIPIGSTISIIICVGFYLWMKRKGKF
jgi:putative MATE family efflux protein